MARSSYIYLLMDGRDGESVIGAFTVKHEMLRAWDRYPYPARCWRYRDGELGAPGVEMFRVTQEDK